MRLATVRTVLVKSEVLTAVSPRRGDGARSLGLPAGEPRPVVRAGGSAVWFCFGGRNGARLHAPGDRVSTHTNCRPLRNLGFRALSSSSSPFLLFLRTRSCRVQRLVPSSARSALAVHSHRHLGLCRLVLAVPPAGRCQACQTSQKTPRSHSVTRFVTLDE